MTQNEYNSYTMSIVDEKTEMPYLCGGYTQTDWDIVSGKLIDPYDVDDYLYAATNGFSDETSDWYKLEFEYKMRITKPYWA